MIEHKPVEPIPPLIVHVVNKLAIGGLENGLVNLINHMPSSRYRHAVLSLQEATTFRRRLRADVPVLCLQKGQGQDVRVHFRIWKVLRELRPAIVHTRNLPTMEYVVPAAFAGVPVRIHGEHGRDVHDDCGRNRRYQIFRRILGRWVHQFTTVSNELANWLVDAVGIPQWKVTQIYNGVDTTRFSPRSGPRPIIGSPEFSASGHFLIGTVGRMQTVKDQLTLVRAFIYLRRTWPQLSQRARLVIVGDGPLRAEAQSLVQEGGIAKLIWMPGEQEDIPNVMRALDLFVLPSQAEGISNTILEAMACGLPVLATRVGGNEELVMEGHTGMLVPPSDPREMAEKMVLYLTDETLGHRHGTAGRKRVEETFSLDSMVTGYQAVYDAALRAYSRSRLCVAR